MALETQKDYQNEISSLKRQLKEDIVFIKDDIEEDIMWCDAANKNCDRAIRIAEEKIKEAKKNGDKEEIKKQESKIEKTLKTKDDNNRRKKRLEAKLQKAKDTEEEIKKQIDKLYKEGTAKGFKLKRADEIIAELRALKTESDYQDKIDDLLREVENLYDEGTDKGFKLKREEDMDQEQRALETQEDYQKQYDKYANEAKKYEEEVKQWQSKINKLSDNQKELNKLIGEKKDAFDNMTNTKESMLYILKQAKKKGFKIKERSEDVDFESRKNSIVADITDLEARKNEVLQGLEARALETEKDYQKEYDRLQGEWESLREECNKLEKISDKARIEFNKANKEYMEKVNEFGKTQTKRDAIYNQAKNKGFKLKRSENVDFETRALKTEDDYQKEYDELKKLIYQEQKAARKSRDEWQIFKAQEEKHLKYAASYIKESEELVNEAKKKGFKIKQ